MLVLDYYRKIGVKPEDVLICVVYPDRASGITKLAGVVPPEYLGRVRVFQISNYEQLIKATATSDRLLREHYKKTGNAKHGWLVIELLGEPWVFSQDHYVQQTYGKDLGAYFAERKRLSEAIRENPSAYKILDGWKDWSVIKLFHNLEWIEKIKLMPHNVWFTAEIKDEENR